MEEEASPGIGCSARMVHALKRKPPSRCSNRKVNPRRSDAMVRLCSRGRTLLKPCRPSGGRVMRKPEKEIRVLVVDDHPVVRRGLSACLAGRPPLQVVGEASDGEEAVRQTLALKPDIVLVDIHLPRMDGLRVTELLRRQAPKVRVLVVSVHSRPEYVQRAIKAGARAYLLKNTTPDEFVHVLERVHRGEVFFQSGSGKINPHAIRHLRQSTAGPQPPQPAGA